MLKFYDTYWHIILVEYFTGHWTSGNWSYSFYLFRHSLASRDAMNGEENSVLRPNSLFRYIADPRWASCKFGVFVCLTCSGVHRSLTGRVKSIKLDNWTDEEVEVEGHLNVDVIVIITLPICLYLHLFDLFVWLEKFMKTMGNASARASFEEAVPVYYYRPQSNDCKWVLISALSGYF